MYPENCILDELHRACSRLSTIAHEWVSNTSRSELLVYSPGNGIRRTSIITNQRGNKSFDFGRPLNCGLARILGIDFDASNYPYIRTDEQRYSIDELNEPSIQILSCYVLDTVTSFSSSLETTR